VGRNLDQPRKINRLASHQAVERVLLSTLPSIT